MTQNPPAAWFCQRPCRRALAGHDQATDGDPLAKMVPTKLEKFLGRGLKRVDDHNATEVLPGLQIFA